MSGALWDIFQTVNRAELELFDSGMVSKIPLTQIEVPDSGEKGSDFNNGSLSGCCFYLCRTDLDRK